MSQHLEREPKPAVRELDEHNPDNYLLLKSQETIDRMVDLQAQRIVDHYGSDPFVMVVILDGALVYGADLLKRINYHLLQRGINPQIRVETVAYSSYRGGKRVKHPEKIKETARRIKHSDRVLLVEDLVDSGKTLRFAQTEFRRRRPQELNTAVLVSKPAEAMGRQIRTVEVPVEFKAFEEEIPAWIAKYTFDVDGLFRGWPGLAGKMDTLDLEWYNKLTEFEKIPDQETWKALLEEKFKAQQAA